jgi:HD superfamily phosphohydrolase
MRGFTHSCLAGHGGHTFTHSRIPASPGTAGRRARINAFTHSHIHILTNKRKILNDPVYGFISIPYGIIFDLIEHPFFQRLRRIKQVGLTHYVYPGALHTRFHHALGALHLMSEAIDVLRFKQVEITDEEAVAVSIAILLHDIGHGPFSHALENTLVDISHEQLSLFFMEELNEQFGGKLELAMRIFQDRYPKHFLHQLVSSQLDMDRMDYLNRDSFYTGVSEGVIGYDRIIKMLTVREGEFVVEEKGIYSIEKFLIARRLMYWQVYLHKTALAAEQMLIATLRRARQLALEGQVLPVSPSLAWFLYDGEGAQLKENRKELLSRFAELDDVDVVAALKAFSAYPGDEQLAYLSRSILNRRLFRVEMSETPFPGAYQEAIRQQIRKNFSSHDPHYLFLSGSEANTAYSTSKEEIKILMKSGEVKPMSEIHDHGVQAKIITRFYLCYPKNMT